MSSSAGQDSSNRFNPTEQKAGQERVDLTITDAIANPIVVLAPDGTTLYANRVALDLSGIAAEEVGEEGFLQRAAHPDDVDRLLEQRRAGFLEGVPFQLEMRSLLKDGGYRWYLAQYKPLKDEQGRIIRWYATATDIDDLKRAEEKLRKSEADFRTITDNIRQSIVVVAPDGTTLYANQVLLDLTGCTLDNVIEYGAFPRNFHPDDVERVRAERQEKLLRDTPFDLQMRLLVKNGQYRWHLFQYEPFKDDRGRVIRWYSTATDIDDQKKTEERLRNENLVLREEIDRSSSLRKSSALQNRYETC